MSVRIRLTRKGKKKQPFYRLVVAESTNQRDGKAIEVLGQYDPTRSPAVFQFEEDRVKYWLGVGAKPTETVHRLLSIEGLLSAVKRKSHLEGVSRKDRKELPSTNGAFGNKANMKGAEEAAGDAGVAEAAAAEVKAEAPAETPATEAAS